MESANTYTDTFGGVSFLRHGDKEKIYEEKAKETSMDLMTRLPSTNVIQNLDSITSLIVGEEFQDLRENIELKTDKPLEIAFDEIDGKQFLKCDYNHCYNNQDGNSYRSPWTNKYFPNVQVDPSSDDQPMYPSQELLEMERKANEVF